MSPEMISILSVALPAVSAAIGSVVATKVSVARLREDVSVLFKQLHELKNNVNTSNLNHEVEHSELKVAIARIQTKIESL